MSWELFLRLTATHFQQILVRVIEAIAQKVLERLGDVDHSFGSTTHKLSDLRLYFG